MIIIIIIFDFTNLLQGLVHIIFLDRNYIKTYKTWALELKNLEIL